MASSQFPNYLRTHRKRLALSQKDVAYLLGVESGAKVSRNEQFARQPGLETALAYEAIFKRPARELFAGLYQRIEKEVAARAKALARKSNGCKSSRLIAHKLQALAEIADIESKESPKKI